MAMSIRDWFFGRKNVKAPSATVKSNASKRSTTQKSSAHKSKYWASDEKMGNRFTGAIQIRMHALSGEGKPHKETLIDFGPWSTGSGDQIIMALLREKQRNSLNEFSNTEIVRIFGRPKDEVIQAFLSGIIGTECYMIAMVLISCKLRKKHGALIEVRCLPQRTDLIYKDGHGISFAEHSGHPDITMMKYGYRGTGPDCFYAFLNEAGFSISLEEIAAIKPPYTLKKEA
jgi:hypothetical protein